MKNKHLILLFIPFVLCGCAKTSELYVIGGKMVYTELLPLVDRLYITRIPGTHEGDVYFPEVNYDEFKLLGTTKEKDLKFEVYERIKK